MLFKNNSENTNPGGKSEIQREVSELKLLIFVLITTIIAIDPELVKFSSEYFVMGVICGVPFIAIMAFLNSIDQEVDSN